MTNNTHETSRSEWRIANDTIYKLLGTGILCYVLIKLCQFLILLSIAIFLACALQPIIRLCERRIAHWLASVVVSISVILILLAVVLGVIPTLVEQFSVVAKKLPESQATLLKNIPGGIGQQVIKSLIQSPAISSEHVVSAGQHFLGTVSDLVFIVAMALYLASDGKRTFMWIRAFFSPVLRRKIDMTAKEGSEIIVAYVLGQVVTSVLCGVFVFIVLSLLHVPAALVLAVMAAAFDILPMLGFFLFTIPAVLFALTVSSSAAITLLILYVIYHFLENYIIVPKIYGKRLRLSELVVLISVLAGACLAGIPGAILILPLVAVYPAFERIWLADYIGRDVVDKHEAVENSPPS